MRAHKQILSILVWGIQSYIHLKIEGRTLLQNVVLLSGETDSLCTMHIQTHIENCGKNAASIWHFQAHRIWISRIAVDNIEHAICRFGAQNSQNKNQYFLQLRLRSLWGVNCFPYIRWTIQWNNFCLPFIAHFYTCSIVCGEEFSSCLGSNYITGTVIAAR